MLLGSRIEKVESSLQTLKERKGGSGKSEGRRGGGSGVAGKLYGEKKLVSKKEKGLTLPLRRCREMSRRNRSTEMEVDGNVFVWVYIDEWIVPHRCSTCAWYISFTTT